MAVSIDDVDNGQRNRGLQVLRDSGWLLDIPHVLKAPELDGRLDDDVWRQAAKTGPFFTWSSRHSATILAERHTEVSVIYTDEALYFGAHCEDASPESLVVQSHERDHADEWNQDLVEFFLDTNFDQRSSCKVTINSVGAITDATSSVPNWKDYDYAWSAESEAAGYQQGSSVPRGQACAGTTLLSQTTSWHIVGLRHVPGLPRWQSVESMDSHTL